MAKKDAEGFYCFVDKDILERWRNEMKGRNIALSKSMEFMMLNQLESLSESGFERFKQGVSDHFEIKRLTKRLDRRNELK